ncbi:DUF397 domain-containing protein [Nocardia sp. CS682]|uniref:DUF397 domain-containing protein n=1 Tax=Nocardia sp. CS682 TaxID=1047172 RepID=UPI0010756FD7|nr:DUF397 domain-containing protein [Nocardia sp. CS682]QBS42433.1 DUF397 domain-containing protein [Nocardia sp. CS682]
MKVDLTDAVWRKSTFSGPDGACVEVAFLKEGNVAVRDTKAQKRGPVLAFTPHEWDAFLGGILAGNFRHV